MKHNVDTIKTQIMIYNFILLSHLDKIIKQYLASKSSDIEDDI